MPEPKNKKPEPLNSIDEKDTVILIKGLIDVVKETKKYDSILDIAFGMLFTNLFGKENINELQVSMNSLGYLEGIISFNESEVNRKNRKMVWKDKELKKYDPNMDESQLGDLEKHYIGKEVYGCENEDLRAIARNMKIFNLNEEYANNKYNIKIAQSYMDNEFGLDHRYYYMSKQPPTSFSEYKKLSSDENKKYNSSYFVFRLLKVTRKTLQNESIQALLCINQYQKDMINSTTIKYIYSLLFQDIFARYIRPTDIFINNDDIGKIFIKTKTFYTQELIYSVLAATQEITKNQVELINDKKERGVEITVFKRGKLSTKVTGEQLIMKLQEEIGKMYREIPSLEEKIEKRNKEKRGKKQ